MDGTGKESAASSGNDPLLAGPAGTIVKPRALEPLLLTAAVAAGLCSVSLRTWRRLDSSGAIPQAIPVGISSKRWRLDELKAWVAADCPSRYEWNQRRRTDDRIRPRTDNSQKRR